DVEAAVSVKHRGIVAVFLEAFAIGDEHRHFRSVLARIEDLLGRVIVRFEIDLRLEEDVALSGLEIVAVNSQRFGETDVGIKALGVLALAHEAARRSEPGQLDFAGGLSGKLEGLYGGMCVLKVTA